MFTISSHYWYVFQALTFDCYDAIIDCCYLRPLKLLDIYEIWVILLLFHQMGETECVYCTNNYNNVLISTFIELYVMMSLIEEIMMCDHEHSVNTTTVWNFSQSLEVELSLKCLAKIYCIQPVKKTENLFH